MTQAQVAVLGLFERRRAAGLPPPTQREIADERGYKSKRAAASVVETLASKGLLVATKEARQACRFGISRRGLEFYQAHRQRLEGLPTYQDLTAEPEPEAAPEPEEPNERE